MESQQVVTGEVRIRLSAGLAQITGRRSPFSMYDEGLATYSHGDTFDRTAAEGFLKLYGLSYQTYANIHIK
jgi:argininosuccinate synthase